MRSIRVTLHENENVSVSPSTVYMGEHRAAQLEVALPRRLRDNFDYYTLSFDQMDAGNRVPIGNIYPGSEGMAYYRNGVIHCQLPDRLTNCSFLRAQVEAHRQEDGQCVEIAKSAAFTIRFEHGIAGHGDTLQAFALGHINELMAKIDVLRQRLDFLLHEEAPADAIFLDFSAGANPNLAANPRLIFAHDPVRTEAPTTTLVVHNGLQCVQPSAGSFIAMRHPRYMSEALEIEYFTTGTSATFSTEPVVVMGNGVNNLGMAQIVHGASDNQNRTFGSATQMSAFALSTADFPHPIGNQRVRLRLERRANRVWTFLAFDGAELRNIRNSTILGTNPASIPGAGVHMGFRTGFAFPSANPRIVSIRWEQLMD